ncbi:TPA: hypothetical protein ACHVEW_001522, partial [Streptococcus suis]
MNYWIHSLPLSYPLGHILEKTKPLKTLIFQGFSLYFHLPCRNFIVKRVVVCFKKYADCSYFCYIFDPFILVFTNFWGEFGARILYLQFLTDCFLQQLAKIDLVLFSNF